MAGLGVVLCAIGMYGVIAHSLERRRKEIGIRVALGADALRVQRLVFGESVRLLALALPFGLAGGLAAGRLLAATLHGVSPYDPLSLAAAAALVGAVLVVANYPVGRRAARIDPAVALRAD